jgi:hypothetical protein
MALPPRFSDCAPISGEKGWMAMVPVTEGWRFAQAAVVLVQICWISGNQFDEERGSVRL